MIVPRLSHERGQTALDWLDSRHTFSFDRYYDPQHMGFRQLRVINEDRVQPGAGFGAHSHRDMEILTYVLEGALEHKDSLGNGSVIHADSVQRMTAGAGVIHSEFNHSNIEPVRFLQIWVLPDRKGLEPGYEELVVGPDTPGRLRLIAAREGRDGAVRIHQDLGLYVARLSAGDQVTHPLAPGRHAWVQLADGDVRVGGLVLRAGDGAALSDEPAVNLAADRDSRLLLFDLA